MMSLETCWRCFARWCSSGDSRIICISCFCKAKCREPSINIKARRRWPWAFAAHLRDDDVMFSTHRPVGHFLAKGCPPAKIAAELWGKATGCAGGKGGQMHLADMSVGAPPSNAIVGANVPIATGAAIGFKLRGLDRVAVSFFGDGAANIGAAHEGFNLAAVKDAPVIFVCENNLYGASTHQSLAMRISDIAKRADGYGMTGVIVDGMDVMAVHQAADRGGRPGPRRAKGRRSWNARPTATPATRAAIRAATAARRRSPTGKPAIRFRDAANCFANNSAESEAELDEVERQCQTEVEDAVKFAQASPDPSPQSVYEHVFAGKEVVA